MIPVEVIIPGVILFSLMLLMPTQSTFWDNLLGINYSLHIAAAISLLIRSFIKRKYNFLPLYFFAIGFLCIEIWFIILGYAETDIIRAIMHGFLKAIVVGCIMFMIGIAFRFLMKRDMV